MESSTRIEQSEQDDELASMMQAGSMEQAGSTVRAPALGTARSRCSVCAANLAPDQRYCVECGHRQGPARVPWRDESARRAGEASSAGGSARRSGIVVNSTLLAIIGTLLLAMGVGVLIGRSSQSARSGTPRVQVVTTGGGTSGAAATTPGTGAEGTSTTSTPGASANKSGAKSGAKKPSKPLPKAVKIGSPGKGPGYQKGHFTGNFFGPEAE